MFLPRFYISCKSPVTAFVSLVYLSLTVGTRTFTSGKYSNQVFNLPPFDGEFVLDFSAQVSKDAIVSLSADNTKDGIKYELGERGPFEC